MRRGPGRRVLDRRRLDALFDRILDFRAGEVSGPPGSGKTTWLRSWAATTQCADVVWLTLEPRHRDALVLARDLLDAVRHTMSVPGAVGDVAVTDVVDQLNQAAEDAGRRLVVVVDEAESVTDAAACHLLRDLIERGDVRFRVVVSGRTVPDVGLEPFRRSGELAYVTAADLRLTAAETAQLVRLVTRSEPSEPVLAAIHEQVDGWALGAVLAGLVLDHAGGSAPESAEGLDGHRFFDQYFGSEVFGALPEDVRAFLVDTCVLSQLEPDLCAELAGREDALAVLRCLEHDNMFVQWMGGRPPVFRYHTLLRSWLSGHLERRDPRRREELDRRAASWFESHGRVAEAIDHRLAAGEVRAAASLIIEYGPSALGEGRYEAIRAWIGALPRPLLSSNGPLLVLLAEAEHRLGDAEATSATRALARGLVARRSAASPLDHFPLTVAVQRATELHRMGWVETAADLGRSALSTVDLTSKPVGDDGVRFDDLLLAMDVASVASQLLFTDALTESARLSRWVIDNFPVDDRNVAAIRVRCLGQAAIAELLRGARPVAAQLAHEALSICRLHGLDPVDVGYAELALLVAGPREERPALDAAVQPRLAQVALPSHTCLAGLLRSWSYVRSGDLATARRVLDEAQHELASLPEPGMLTSLERRVHAMVGAGSDEPPLGARDREVLSVLAASSSRRMAARELHLSLNTVKTYARRVYRALGVSTLTDAVERCEALGIELDVPGHIRITPGDEAHDLREPDIVR